MSPDHYSGDGDRVDHAVSLFPSGTTALEIPLGSGTHAKRMVVALIASELRSSAGRYSAEEVHSQPTNAAEPRRCGEYLRRGGERQLRQLGSQRYSVEKVPMTTEGTGATSIG